MAKLCLHHIDTRVVTCVSLPAKHPVARDWLRIVFKIWEQNFAIRGIQVPYLDLKFSANSAVVDSGFSA